MPIPVILVGARRAGVTVAGVGRLRIDRITGPPAPLWAHGRVVVPRCHLAASPLARLVGLLATPDLTGDDGLWLPGCASVHALGLRAVIGCAFLDGGGRVLRVVDPLPRGGVVSVRGARAVVECAAGVLAPVSPGDVLSRAEIAATSELIVTDGG